MTSIEDRILEADKIFEKAWEKHISISRELAPNDETQFALRRLISYNPSNTTISEYDTELHNHAKVIESLANNLSNQISKISDNESLWIRLGHCYFLLHDFTNAQASYLQAKSINPSIDDPYFWFCLGIIYQHFTYYNQALECYNNTTKCSSTIDCPSEFNFKLGVLYRALERYEEALASFESIKIDPPGNLKIEDIMFQIAYTNQLAGNAEAAYSIYNELYMNHPNNLFIIQQITWFISLQTQKDKLEYGKKIIDSLTPDQFKNPRIKLASARILMGLDDLATSYTQFCEGLSFWIDNPVIWAGLAELYNKNDQLDDVLVALRRVLFLNPYIAEGWLNFTYICEKQNDRSSAIKVITQAVQMLPNSLEIRARYQDIQRGKPASGMIRMTKMPFFTEVAEKEGTKCANNIIELPYTCVSDDPTIKQSIKVLCRKSQSIFY